MTSYEKDTVSNSGLTTVSMMDSGRMIWPMEKESWCNPMVPFTKVSLPMIMPMVEESTVLAIKRSPIKENFRRMLSMAME